MKNDNDSTNFKFNYYQMETKEIDGVLYKLVPEEREKSCSGCVFKDPNGAICTILTKDCNRGLIYKKVDEPKSNPRLKLFNLEAAKEGKPVCTRDRRKVRIICFDTKGDMHPIIALVETNGIESAYYYDKNGRNGKKSGLDLMMLPEKKEGWVNVMEGTAGKVYVGNNIYRTEDEAKEGASRFTSKLIASVPIEWEE